MTDEAEEKQKFAPILGLLKNLEKCIILFETEETIKDVC